MGPVTSPTLQKHPLALEGGKVRILRADLVLFFSTFFACILCLSNVLSPFCGQKGLQPRRRYFVRQRDALENHNWIARAGFSHHARLPVCNRRLGVASAPAPCGLVPALRARRCLTSQKSWPAYFKPWRGRPVPNVARPRTCYNYIERLCSLTSVHIPCGHVGKNMG